MRKQVLKNVSMNIISLACNVTIGILLIPYLVNRLGVIAYGLIPLSMLIVEYMSLVTQSICSSINRYLSIAINNNHKEIDDERHVIFNTSLFGIIALVIIQFILFICPILNIDDWIDINDLLVNDVIYLFLFVFFSYLVSLISSVFSVSMYAKNRLDLMQFSNIARVLIRTFLIIILFECYAVNLEIVGLATFVSSSLTLLYSIYWFYKLTPDIKINIAFFKYRKVKVLGSFGGWLLINQVGFLLLSRFDIFLVNQLIGAESSGEYAIVVQLSNLIRSLLGVFSGIIGPIIITLYAKGEIDRIKEITYTFSKMITLVSIVPISILLFNSKAILNLWLGSGYDKLIPLLIILVAPLIFNIGVLPIFSVNTALNKVKIPGVLSLIFGMLYIILSILLVRHTDLGMYAVAISSMLALSIKNAIFTPIYAAYILNQKWYRYLQIQMVGLVYFLICGSIAFSIKGFYCDEDELLINLMLTLIIITPLLFLFLNKKELILISSNIRQR
ncbi:hypothetical protein EA004_06310 [Vibrio anguillarum]|nr:hypothetical protein [Vibrio anguillarum]